MHQQEENNLTNARMVVSVLMTGTALKTRDIAEAVSRMAGREVAPAVVAGLLARISDPSRSDLGNFIRKYKDGGAWVFTMIPAALVLSESQAYRLTQKTGPDRYTLMQALRDYPGLHEEIEPTIAAPVQKKPFFRIMRTLADKVRPGRRINITSRKDAGPAGHPIEVSIRYSGRHTFSILTSLRTFILLCLAAVITVAACCLVIYSILFPLVLLAFTAAAGWLGWRIYRNAGRSAKSASGPLQHRAARRSSGGFGVFGRPTHHGAPEGEFDDRKL